MDGQPNSAACERAGLRLDQKRRVAVIADRRPGYAIQFRVETRSNLGPVAAGGAGHAHGPGRRASDRRDYPCGDADHNGSVRDERRGLRGCRCGQREVLA